MTVRMQALARYRHRGVMMQAGEAFEVDTPDEAADLVAVGFARRADVAAIEQPDPAPQPGDADRYARRDMRPQK
jgi:hypothetical protein